MSRYIDADALKQNLKENYTFYGFVDLLKDFYVAIDEEPIIDIVRCRECKHRYDDGWIEPRWTCDYLKDMRLKDDDFCSYGKRSEIPTGSTISKMEQVDEPQTNADQHVQRFENVEPMQMDYWSKEKHEAFYEYLWNIINPNEMQEYISMFESKDEPQTERSE